MFTWILLGECIGIALWFAARWRQKQKRRTLLAAHSIDAGELHRLMGSVSDLRVYDVRQPLDLLAHSEIIPGSERISPKDIMANPALISNDVDAVVYCTCPGDTTAEQIISRALSLSLVRVRILTGGLEAWKAGGFPVEQYTTAFHLDTPV